LRLDLGGLQAGDGIGRPVRQGRAPLRLPPGAAGPGAGDLVVPSAKDGLHCGRGDGVAAGLGPDRSSRPPRTGSIAARRRMMDWFCPCCRPVRQGRAPLRLVPAGTARRPRGPSSRPPRTGSIAACAAAASRAGPRGVVPSAKDGLHCGRMC